MQPAATPHTPDNPTSPARLFPHHAPQPADTPPSLRHRTPRHYHHHDQPAQINTVRIRFKTPHSGAEAGLDRIKEGWEFGQDVLVGDIKNRLSEGSLEGAGRWVRDGMRFVYRGQILKDQQKIKDALGAGPSNDQVFTIHIVARHIADSFEYAAGSSTAPLVAVTRIEEPTYSAAQSGAYSSLNSFAVLESIHFILFLSRYNLSVILGLKPMEWHETSPPPIVDIEEARQGVISVIRAFADVRMASEEGWEDWHIACSGISPEEMTVGYNDPAQRGVIENNIRTTFSSLVGRNWTDRYSGQVIETEIEGQVYTVQLPSMDQCSPEILARLYVYLRQLALVPLLNNVLYDAMSQQQQSQPALAPTPAPTRTVPVPPILLPTPTLASYGTFLYHFFHAFYGRFDGILLRQLAFATIRVFFLFSMFTYSLKWTDPMYWVICAVSALWWASTYWPLFTLAWRSAWRETYGPLEDAIRANGERRGGPQGRDQAAPRAAERQTPTPRNPTSMPRGHLLARAHLATDRSLIAARRRQPPPWWQTQLALPIVLWVITLIPTYEAQRARIIRLRERAMRERALPAGGDAAGGAAGEDNVPAPEPVIPEGLAPVARRYYERVLSRTERIDWDEEREAQRAMGVGEDGEGGAGGIA
ncbi:hypothetical protein L202_01514 [Cryptococcus amylolentus CBS 6039]|uniref:Ubiquitin-like domain-containing protein n=2 Tax=Cryptococcus amylolentus TaxID=104669 RepID=A0A1E3I491_9TREE|nr:hypothetical protein L202_01514 [Cryptococcus amylolentus CBS 6039]ODN83358.1 hypothetical protein L202_01514 [Cryptococcus amylolentus CBS 6039]ODO10899.1 hypothetical protein I350_01498 [Cryptococcus amylolentus CBS 6273]